MKFVRVVLSAVFALAATSAYAFHSGGVGECEGCHTMHNSLDGQVVERENVYDTTTKTTVAGPVSLTYLQAGPYLLKSSSQSGACLNCHQSPDTAPTGYHIATDGALLGAGSAPVEMTPGGDFGWLKKTYTFAVRGTPETEFGDSHGHNINAAEFGYNKEAQNATGVAPGGTYPTANLACSSCHDPHGRYRRTSDTISSATYTTSGAIIYTSGSYGATPKATWAVGAYRLLAGAAYLPKSVTDTTLTFVNAPPAAVAPSSYNKTESTSQLRVGYGAGMSEWCSNCHGGMHNATNYTSGTPGLVHPTGPDAVLSKGYPNPIYVNYNAYVMTGNMTGTSSNSFNSLVPFEAGSDATTFGTDLKGLAKYASAALGGASANSQAMCLSCHRAHASGFPSMTRYPLENEFMTVADATTNVAIYDSSTTEGKINRGKTVAEQQAALYDRPATVFAPWQRNLCNKCHAKD